MSGDSPAGTIAAVLGDSLDRVAAQSSYPFDLSRLQDDDLVTVSEPVTFSYPGFQPMITRFLGLTVTAAIVISIELAPHLEYIDLVAALALADRLEAEAQRAGWTPATRQSGVTGRSELGVLLADPAGSEQQSWYIARYAQGSARLAFRLRRTHRATQGDLMLLNLVWSDEALGERANEIAGILRREDAVPVEYWRPIDLRRYAPRASALLRQK